MRFINKSRITPRAFIDIVTPTVQGTVNVGYDHLNDKRPFRQFLIDEQHGLCAYCNQNITLQTSSIEHLICQSHNRALDLNYHNIFAVCKGNEGVIPKSHCDKFRANRSKNDYFFPFILFKDCLTESWDKINPFFDIEFNRKTLVVSGKILAKEAKVPGYPSVKTHIDHVIKILNLNAPILVEARNYKWSLVMQTKEKLQLDWQELFDYYLNTAPYTGFDEFVLLAIKKQK